MTSSPAVIYMRTVQAVSTYLLTPSGSVPSPPPWARSVGASSACSVAGQMSLLIDQLSFSTWTCSIAVATAVLVLVTYRGFRSQRDATLTAAPKAKPPRASKAAVAKQKAVSKQKTTPAAAGLVRQCYFCEVLVTTEQMETHCRGKKHQRLAGSTDAADCWCWVPAAAEPDGSCAPCPAPAGAAATATAADGGDGARPVSTSSWQAVASGKKGRRPPPAAVAAAAARAEDYRLLPTLGFKVVNGAEPILPLIRSGHKSIELRRQGARLSDGTVMDRLQPGDRFVGEPLASSLTYKCVIQVTGPVEFYESHGAAWEAHGARAVPRSLGPIRSAAEAQRFYERSFYDGRVLVHEPVLAIPVAMVGWVEE